MSFRVSIKIPHQKDKIFYFFHDIERLIRLNPQWAVNSIEGNVAPITGSQFFLHVKYDRTGQEVKFNAKVLEFIEGQRLTIKLDSQSISKTFLITTTEEGNSTIIEYNDLSEDEPSEKEKIEIYYWIRSIANYINIQQKKSLFSKIWKWFIDRLWLKMSPMGRRIVLIIVLFESLALVFFLFLLIYFLIFKGF